MRKILSALFSTLQGGVREGLLFLALLATTILWARPFQVGDLYYKVTEDNGIESLPFVPNPGAGRTTVVLYVPANTPAGCYAIGTVNGWDVGNTDFMFTPVEGTGECWVACTFDYALDMQIKVIAIPSHSDYPLDWSFQWGKNMDYDEGNVVVLEGTGYLEPEIDSPKLVALADDGVVYIEIKDWANDPYIEPIPCESAAFHHPWDGGDWIYREATKTTDATFELNARYGGNGVGVATDVNGKNPIWYSEDQIEFVGDVALGDSVNFKFVSEIRTLGRMIVTLIEKGTGVDTPWYTPSKKSPTVPQKRASTDSRRKVVVTYQSELSDNYAYLTTAYILETFVYKGTTYEVVGIDEYAFANSPISSIIIPNSVTSIGNGAFAGCKSLTSITIPNSVTNIGSGEYKYGFWEGLFSGCSSLKSIIVQDGNLVYDSRNNCNAIVETATNTVVVGCQATNMPSSITSIGPGAFAGHENLTSIYMPTSITNIGHAAFQNCSALTSITIPNSVTSIGDETFQDCSSLTSITIPNSVTSIGKGAFRYCSSLTSVTIGNNVTSIGDEAFSGCNELTKIIILPTHLNSFGSLNNSFKSSIVDTIVAPAFFYDISESSWATTPKHMKYVKVTTGELSENAFGFINRSYKTLKVLNLAATSNTSLADEAFKGCYNLDSLYLPFNLTYIPYMAVADCKSLKSITIPSTVEEIDNSAFENCCSLNSIIFEGAEPAQGHARYAAASGSSLWRIGSWAFYNCHQLQNLTIPEGVTEVGDAAFYGCTYLEDMVLPSTIQEIGDNGFTLCAKLKKMHVKATTPPTIYSKTFEDVDRAMPVYVPNESVDAYKEALYWKELNVQALTAVDNIPTNKDFAHKFLRNGQLLIIRDGKTYNVMGAEVK